MAAGRVVVGTRGASFEQLIETGHSGLLVQPGDADALQSAMAEVSRMSEAERAQIGTAAKERIVRLHPDIAISRLEALFQATIARKNAKALRHGGSAA